MNITAVNIIMLENLYLNGTPSLLYNKSMTLLKRRTIY